MLIIMSFEFTKYQPPKINLKFSGMDIIIISNFMYHRMALFYFKQNNYTLGSTLV